MTIEISAEELAEFDYERSRKTEFPRLALWSELDDRERREWIESADMAIGDWFRVRRYRDARDLLLLRKAIDQYREAQDAADKARKLGPERTPCPLCHGSGTIEGYPCGICGSRGTVPSYDEIRAAEAEERIALEELEEARRGVDE